MDYDNNEEYLEEDESTLEYNNTHLTRSDNHSAQNMHFNINNESEVDYEQNEDDKDDDDKDDDAEYLFNLSCIEPLLLEKLKKAQENDQSYLRQTMSANDISRYERQYALQQEQEYEEDEDGIESINRTHEHHNNNSSQSHENNSEPIERVNMQYDQIEALEGSDNLNETPIKNVSHISEVSKSKENSEQQYHNKLNSINSQKGNREQQDKVNNEYFSKENKHSQKDNKEDSNNQTNSIITYNNDKEKNSIQNEYSDQYENNGNDDSHDKKYIGDRYDYEDESIEISYVSFAHSVPPLQRKIKLSLPTESIDSYQQEMYEQYEDFEDDIDIHSNKEEITMPNTLNQHYQDIDVSSNQNVITNQDIMASNISNLSKNASSEKSKKSNNASSKYKNKKNQCSKSSKRNVFNGSKNDISNSSIRSDNNKGSVNKTSTNKSTSITLLDETPLSDEETKIELIKMAKKIYGNKLNTIQLKKMSYLFEVIVYELKELIQSNENESKSQNSKNGNKTESEKSITKEFLLLNEKHLHNVLVYYIDSFIKQNKIHTQQKKQCGTNTFVIKRIHEVQNQLLASNIKRKEQELDVASKMKTFDCFKYFDLYFGEALYNEDVRYENQRKTRKIKMIRDEEERNKVIGENVKFYNDKIGILAVMLMREQKKNNEEKKRKQMFMEVMKKRTKKEKRRIFDEFIERIDEEDRNEDYMDNNQQQIQNLVNTYYPKK